MAGYQRRSTGAWSGDLWIIDWDNMEEARTVQAVTQKRFKAPEVQVFGCKNEPFYFPVADGVLAEPGETRTRLRVQRMYPHEGKTPQERRAEAEAERLQAEEESDAVRLLTVREKVELSQLVRKRDARIGLSRRQSVLG